MQNPTLAITLLGGFVVAGDGAVVPPDAWRLDRYARLVDLKRRWDPTNAFHLNQNIAPGASGTR